MSNRYMLKNNKIFTNSTSLLRDLRPGGRALVLSNGDPLPSEWGKLSDFFDIVIVESEASYKSAGYADVCFYKEPSAYSGGVFSMDWCSGFPDVIFAINHGAIRDLVKIKRDLNIFNISYIPDDVAVGASPAGPAGASLSKEAPGVHLARIIGAKTVYSDYASSGSVFMDRDQLGTYMLEKENLKFGWRFKNQLRASRQSLLKACL